MRRGKLKSPRPQAQRHNRKCIYDSLHAVSSFIMSSSIRRRTSHLFFCIQNPSRILLLTGSSIPEVILQIIYHPFLKMPSLVEIKQYLGGQVFGKPFVLDLNLSNKVYAITGANTGLGLSVPSTCKLIQCTHERKQLTPYKERASMLERSSSAVGT